MLQQRLVLKGISLCVCVCVCTLSPKKFENIFFPPIKVFGPFFNAKKSRPVGVKQSLQHYVYVNLILLCLSSSSSSAFSIARSCIIDKLVDNIGQCILKGP